MAKTTVKIPNSFIDHLITVANSVDAFSEKALQEGAEEVVGVFRKNLKAVLGPKKRTGQLLHAVGVSPVQVDYRGDHNIKIGFAEPREAKGKETTVNAKIANILEYGRPGQAPRPFVSRTKRATQAPATERMKRSFEEQIEAAQ